MKGSNIIGLDIKNAQNETIGEIEDVVVGSDGKVEQVVVSVGGFLGLGSKNVAIDWSQLQMNPSQDTAMVNMTKDQLKSMQEYKSPRQQASQPASRPAGSTGSTTGTPPRSQ